MRISIFTPTHNAKYLPDAYEALKDQDFYEWVICPNNGAVVPDFNDPRVKVIPCESTKGFVGELKKFATEKCTGDILLELDHDDILMPTACHEVKMAFLSDPEVGFVYSNHADFRGDLERSQLYNPNHGWKWRKFTYKGKELDETIAFEPCPLSVSRIWYAPNHLRAWRKDILEKAGGYNPNLRVLDDQDLMSRTYLVTKFHHIDKPLYLYRIDNNNTWLVHNKEIQDGVYPMYYSYIYDITKKWCRNNKYRMMDFGGAFNLDKDLECVDIKTGIDLNKTLPFDDSSVGMIRANDILEHLDDKLHIIKEMYRVLVPGGIIFSMTPSATSPAAFQDPTHKQFYVENSFKYYTQEKYSRFIDTPVKFQAVQLYTTTPDAENNSWIVAHLAAVKGQRIPGLVEI